MGPSIVASLCLASCLGLALGCGGSSPPKPKQAADARGNSDAEPDGEAEEEARAPRRERRLDPSISLGNLRERLSPYLDSIGAGFGPGYRPSGIVSISAGGEKGCRRALLRRHAGSPPAGVELAPALP